MQKESRCTETVMAENERLRRQIDELQGLEARCQRAETALAAIETRNQLLSDAAPLGIFTIDAQGRVTGINRRGQALLGPLMDGDPRSANLFDDASMGNAGLTEDLQHCMTLRRPITVEHSHADRQGNGFWLRYYLSPAPTQDGAIDGVMAIVEDATDLKRTEEALRDSEKRYRQLFQSAPIALIEWDVSQLKAHLDLLRASGVTDFDDYLTQHPDAIRHCWELIKTVDYNQAFLELMGIADRAGPKGAFLPTHADDFVKMAREVILVTADGNTAVEREASIVTTSGERKIVLGKSLAVSGHEETLARVAIALLDISQRKRAEAALRESERRFREQAFRDGLTGLYNQRYLYGSLATWAERAKANGTPLSLIFMDLDHFKRIVDTHGHLNGSRAIQKVAQTINRCLAEPAYAVAYAGDEFVVVLPGMNAQAALAKAQEIRSTMNTTAYELEKGVVVQLRASFGIATFPEDASDLKRLIAAADQALFAIKGAGKNAIGQYRSA
ncbi:hypothetical protein JCM12296A_30200 [Desulfosarcina cetonica]|uniref:sensor domain-containing diguanylate cyclase n=1 Tax=Desulfosarcina cetonica TaxID=90730 RepID=UPI00155D8818|nr:sensor domain-containing diguanylate cyclase [Desulfosarcina cetonica]